MTQSERLEFLIKYLISEREEYRGVVIPENVNERFKLFRSLVNVRPPRAIGADFLAVQDEYLKVEITGKGVTDIEDLDDVAEGIKLWKGDITTLRCGAIVNAANSGMTGCYVPCHGCIDNAIHTFAGVQLRLECARMMAKQGHDEPTGKAKITLSYNLPSKYVIHTVGPIIRKGVTKRDRELLALCYRSCLEAAQDNGVKSVAFPCISTGEFCFPNELAAEIAIKSVKKYKRDIEVVFNVYKECDYKIYRNLLE